MSIERGDADSRKRARQHDGRRRGDKNVPVQARRETREEDQDDGKRDQQNAIELERARQVEPGVEDARDDEEREHGNGDGIANGREDTGCRVPPCHASDQPFISVDQRLDHVVQERGAAGAVETR